MVPFSSRRISTRASSALLALSVALSGAALVGSGCDNQCTSVGQGGMFGGQGIGGPGGAGFGMGGGGFAEDCDLQGGGEGFLNASPRATWLHVEAHGGTAVVTFWVQDPEGDSVDIRAFWVNAAGQDGEVVLMPGDFPLQGRVTRDALLDPNGQEHRLRWDLSDVPEGELQLVFELNDKPMMRPWGDPYISPPFDPRQGLDPAQRWEYLEELPGG